MRRTLLLILLLIPALLLSAPIGAQAQSAGSWWGSSSWWDWSDYRAEFGAKLYLARLQSGSLTVNGNEFDLVDDFRITDDPEPAREVWGVFRIDRLGLRFSYVAPDIFESSINPNVATQFPAKLEMSPGRIGLDIDILRYPFARFGVNGDIHLESPRITGYNSATQEFQKAEGSSPITIGLHAFAIPLRVRDIPVTMLGRIRVPYSLLLPFLERQDEGKILEWEIGGGLRPAIWDTSLYGHATFSAFIEAGFRQTRAEFSMNGGNVELKAVWQGAFFQLGAMW